MIFKEQLNNGLNMPKIMSRLYSYYNKLRTGGVLMALRSYGPSATVILHGCDNSANLQVNVLISIYKV